MEKNKSPDAFFAKDRPWRDELIALRKVLLAAGLAEEIKWGMPCYTFDGKNIVGIGAFKSYFGLWFHQGALLKDEKKVLINAQEGKTRALRQWRMASAKDIRPAVIKAYVKEAIAVQKAGKEIKPARGKAVVLPPELKSALAKKQARRGGV